MSPVSAKIREQVRQRAGQHCEYCRKPEGVSAYSHQVEHIIAVKHDGPSTLDNLAWACFQCNNNKGSDIASYDKETNTLAPLYNPRQDHWEDHFALDASMIVGKTPIGRVTIRILQMNHPDQLETRAYLLDAGLL